MKLNVFNSLIGLCVATAAVSCSDALVDDVNMRPVGGEESDMISFVVANHTTRGGSFGNRPCGGAYIRTADGADSLYMKAEVADMNVLSTRADEFNENKQPKSLFMTCRVRTNGNSYYHYFENERFDEKEGIWSSNPPRWWLSNDTHFNFYGYYAPAEVLEKENSELKFNGNSDKVVPVPTLEYTIPSNISEHFDLVYSSNASTEFIANYKQLVTLPMNHALAKVAFKIGTLPDGKEIESISINNVNNGGTLNLGTGDWTVDDNSTDSYTLSKWLKEDEEPVIGENCFAVLPGLLSDAVEVSVKVKGETDPYTYYLKEVTKEWEAGKKYIYTISIEEDLPAITIDLVPETVDAHYVIAKAHISAPSLESGQEWELVLSYDGDDQPNAEKVTGLKELNKIQQQGYWTDKQYYKPENSETWQDQGSARGNSIVTGTTDQDVYIFVPENINTSSREIKMELRLKTSKSSTLVESQSFTQNCPDWTGSFGWENIEEYPEVEWGFYGKRNVKYSYEGFWAFVYHWLSGSNIEDYGASGYAKRDWHITSIFPARSISITTITYSSVTSFSDEFLSALSYDDGRSTTDKIYNHSKGIITGALESSLDQVYGLDHKTVDGKLNMESAAFSCALRKNKYDLKIVSKKDDNGELVESPMVELVKLSWYLPAKNQFGSAPTLNPLSGGEYWSSNPADGSSNAYTNVASRPRDEKHKIRACRNKD